MGSSRTKFMEEAGGAVGRASPPRAKAQGGPWGTVITGPDGQPVEGGTTPAAPKPTTTVNANAEPSAAPAASGPSFWDRAGGFLFGDGKQPGVLGSGMYNVQAPEVNMGAGALPNADATRGAFAKEIQDAKSRQVGQDFRNAQTGLMTDLQAASRGEGPSVAQQQLRQGTEANLAASVAAANSVRGQAAGSQTGQLLAQRGQITQQLAADSGMLRAQEQLAARQQLANVSASGRAQDLQAQAQQDDLVRAYMSMGLDVDKAEQAAAMEMERLRVNAGLQTEQLRLGAHDGAAGRRMSLVKSITEGLGRALGTGAGGGGGGGGGG